MLATQGAKRLAFVLVLALFAAILLAWNNQVSTARDDAAMGITPQQFGSLAGGPKPAAFFFSTTGCSQCEQMRPLWQQLSITHGGFFTFTEVSYSLVTSSLFDKYNVTNTPVFLVFVGGSELSRHDGIFSSPSAMLDFVEFAAAGTVAFSSQQASGLGSAIAGDLPSVLISLVLGLGAFASPCVLPLLPGYLSVLMRSANGAKPRLGLSPLWTFLISAAGILLFGAMFVLVGDLLWSFLLSGKLLVSFLLMAVGLGSLMGMGFWSTMPGVINSLAIPRMGSGGVAVYSLFYAIASLGCSLPLVVGGILNVLDGFNLYSMIARLAAFAVGFAAPFSALTLLTGHGMVISASRLGHESKLLQRVGSVAIIIASLLVLATV